MKQHWLHIVLGIFLCTTSVHAQLDSIQQLPEILLIDAKLIPFSKGYKIEKLSDSLVERNATSLTETLRYNTSIYFKENGFGMVSSPSFRGTNAAQTAVVWNGININSVFTGQTDFNTISPLNYNEISIRSGGGGVQYGSGAIGGSIHLNNTFSFKKVDTTEIGLQYGSFSTLGGSASTTHAKHDYYVNVGVDFINSENNYDYIGKHKTNTHGEFLRFASKLNAAKNLKNGLATWNSEYIFNDRNFPGSLTTIGKDAYKDIATRNLFQLQQNIGAFTTKASIAHLFEEYKYFPDSEKPLYDGGKASTFIGALQSDAVLLKNLRLNTKVTYHYIDARGENIGENTRKTLAVVVLLNHNVSKKFTYGLNFRKEFLNGFDNPLLFSADAKWTISNDYAIRINGSKNYRVPTFNDLYWYAGGNNTLQPETSYQIELGQGLIFKDFKFDLAGFYISSEDLIKWVPGNGGLWQPVNISKTRNYGLEFIIDYTLKISPKHFLSLAANYSYTKAEDLEKETQLMYVPFNKAGGALSYNYKQFLFYIQGLYNGKAYTTTDNSDSVVAFTVFNLGGEFILPFKSNITIGGRLKNVFNRYYESVAYRPMPSRNYQLFLNFKF
ncbi:TonB-dependent receptor [Aequorivita sp. Q41]|uniref:TonB-dependent receptor n=1 Tax=Aequorivita sp. Q41 TaxID=3153300 RepID=UPI003242CC58